MNKKRSFIWKFLEKPIDESVIDHDEIKEVEFEVIENPDNSTPHPPPEESISSEKIFDNCDNLQINSEAYSLIVLVPVLVPISQPSDDLMIDNGNLEYNFSLSPPDHYEQWLTFHHDSPMQSFIKNFKAYQT